MNNKIEFNYNNLSQDSTSRDLIAGSSNLETSLDSADKPRNVGVSISQEFFHAEALAPLATKLDFKLNSWHFLTHSLIQEEQYMIQDESVREKLKQWLGQIFSPSPPDSLFISENFQASYEPIREAVKTYPANKTYLRIEIEKAMQSEHEFNHLIDEMLSALNSLD